MYFFLILILCVDCNDQYDHKRPMFPFMFSIFDRGCCTTSAEITTARWKHFNGRKSRAMFFLFLSCSSSINRYFCCYFIVVVECFVLHVLFCFFVSSGPSCIGKTITVCGTSWVRRWPTAVEVNKPFPRTKKHCPLNPSR